MTRELQALVDAAEAHLRTERTSQYFTKEGDEKSDPDYVNRSTDEIAAALVDNVLAEEALLVALENAKAKIRSDKS